MATKKKVSQKTIMEKVYDKLLDIEQIEASLPDNSPLLKRRLKVVYDKNAKLEKRIEYYRNKVAELEIEKLKTSFKYTAEKLENQKYEKQIQWYHEQLERYKKLDQEPKS
jgi:hypothetical protein